MVWFIVAGVASGIIAGMGMGGGTLLIPILTLLLSFPQKVAQCVNLIAFIPMAIVALIIHIKNKLVVFKTGLFIVIPGVVVAIGSAILANSIKSELLRIVFAVFLILVGLFQVFHLIKTILFNIKLKKSNKIAYYYSTEIYNIKKID